MKKAWKIFGNAIVCLIAVMVIAMMIFTIISVSTFSRNDRSNFGYRLLVVLSDSMSATDFQAGDLIIVKKDIEPQTLQPRDKIWGSSLPERIAGKERWLNMNRMIDHDKRDTANRVSIRSMLLVSVLSFVICIVMLASCSIAWFSAVVKGPKLKIQTGVFGVILEVRRSETMVSQVGVSVEDGLVMMEELLGNESVSIWLAAGKLYQFVLTATGDAGKGFCVVKVGDIAYHTASILKGEQLSFTVSTPVSDTVVVEIQPYWGEYQDELAAENELEDGACINVSSDVEEESTEKENSTAEEITIAEEISTAEETITAGGMTTAEKSTTEEDTTVSAESVPADE